MARYTGPKAKVNRKFGEPVFGNVKSKKTTPPGEHGNSRRRRASEYGNQLREKQRAKYTYGVLERQFRNYYKKASRMPGVRGEVLLQLLEQRLDNVVFRLGLAKSRAAARQLVNHRHIIVDGKVVDIPSYSVQPGQVVGVRERDKNLEVIREAVQSLGHNQYSWIAWDAAAQAGTFLHVPERADIPENIVEQSIIELYSK